MTITVVTIISYTRGRRYNNNMEAYCLQTVMASFIMWQSVHMVCAFLNRQFLHSRLGQQVVSDRKRRSKLIERGPTYAVSTLHALFAIYRGLQHAPVVFRASRFLKVHIPSSVVYSPRVHELKIMNELHRIEWTNLMLTSYLLSDLYHVLMLYPKLGGKDILFHHLAFLYCSFIGGFYKVNPFMFCWLILGESSTPLLNLRWFLINAGYGHTIFLRAVEMVFAIVFFLARFVVYGIGILYQVPIFSYYPSFVPQWATYSAFIVVVAGFFVNLFWLTTIAKIAVRSIYPPSLSTGNDLNETENSKSQ